MKLSLKLVVLALCSVTAIQAMEVDSDQGELEKRILDETPQLVDRFSQESVDSFKTTLLQSEQVRGRYQMLVGAIGAGMAGYALYQAGKSVYEWWDEKNERAVEENKYVHNRLGEHYDRQRELLKRVAKLETKLDAGQDYANMAWSEYFLHKTKGFFGGVARLVPKVGASVATIALVSHSHSIVKRLFPDVGDYLFEGRTIGWCIETKTSLRKCVRDLAHWADDLVRLPVQPNQLSCLSSSMRIFIKEVEKVVGFMSCIKNRLPVGAEQEIKRAAFSIKLIEKLANDLADETNGRISGEIALNNDNKADFAQLVKAKVSGIVGQMEKFEVVQQSLGYDNLERINTFDDIRAELLPEVKKLRAEVKEFRQLLANLREVGQEA